jgi:hypothetical protein
MRRALPRLAGVLLLLLASPLADAVSPRDMYNVVLIGHAGGGDDSRRVIVEIPKDKWLVITDVTPTGASRFQNVVRVFERGADQHDTPKLVTSDSFNSVTGIPFKPGSKLVVVDSDWFTVTFTGYWTAN